MPAHAASFTPMTAVTPEVSHCLPSSCHTSSSRFLRLPQLSAPTAGAGLSLMVDVQDHEMTLEDEYDEEADSDFGVSGSDAGNLSSESDGDGQPAENAIESSRKRRKTEKVQTKMITELDSGDEATIREQKKTRKKTKGEPETLVADGDNESEGWRARTRAMHAQEKDERRRNKLAPSKGSTIDVDKIWEEMNKPAALPPPYTETNSADPTQQLGEMDSSRNLNNHSGDSEKENVPANDRDETITIKRTYKFAGEVHIEEKTVLKSSAEAQLWMSQQRPSKGSTAMADGKVLNRPLRKISRFDPNFSNMEAFKSSWAAANAQEAKFTAPKLNVVEKSKMDWAEHVDTEGLKEELDMHAKAREGYLTRMDFLKEVEERKEAEARTARLKER